jgi:hypothetical protein
MQGPAAAAVRRPARDRDLPRCGTHPQRSRCASCNTDPLLGRPEKPPARIRPPTSAWPHLAGADPASGRLRRTRACSHHHDGDRERLRHRGAGVRIAGVRNTRPKRSRPDTVRPPGQAAGPLLAATADPGAHERAAPAWTASRTTSASSCGCRRSGTAVFCTRAAAATTALIRPRSGPQAPRLCAQPRLRGRHHRRRPPGTGCRLRLRSGGARRQRVQRTRPRGRDRQGHRAPLVRQARRPFLLHRLLRRRPPGP